MRALIPVLMAAPLLLASNSAGAEPTGLNPGTFLIVEAELGYGWGGAFAEHPEGSTWGITLGAGGKPRGWPVRFYGIARLKWSSLSDDRADARERSSTNRELFEWMFGLRILAPITGQLHFFGEAAMGSCTVVSEAALGGGAELISNDDASFLVNLGFGLRYRLHYNVSLGGRVDFGLPTGLESYDPLAEAAGVPSNDAGPANIGVAGVVTLHF